jgi:hypothetical protein
MMTPAMNAPTIDPFSEPEAKQTQAARVIAKFGGAQVLGKALARVSGRDRSRVYRWGYPKSKGGTGGVIPSSVIADVLTAARLEGVHLTAEDLDPRPR